MLGALAATAAVLSTDFGADDITLTKWAHASIGTGLSNELACIVGERVRAICLGAYLNSGISLPVLDQLVGVGAPTPAHAGGVYLTQLNARVEAVLRSSTQESGTDLATPGRSCQGME